MACSPTPTETQYATVVTSLSSALFSDSVSQLPALTVTLTSVSCSPTEAIANATGCVDVPVPFVTTIDGGQITVQVPVFTLLSVTQVIPTETLFETCSSPSPPPSAIPPQSDPSPAPSSAPSPHPIPLPDLSSSSLSSTLSSALSITRTSSSSLLSSSLPSTPTTAPRGGSGSTTTTTFTSTSTGTPLPNPTGMPGPSDSDNTTTQQDATTTAHSESIVGPIVGGILGGFFGLIGIALLIWYLWRKRRQVLGIRSRSPSPPPEVPEMSYKRSSRKRDSRATFPDDLDPKPYQYGTVGSLRTHGRNESYPGTSRHSSLHSHDHSPTTPRTISYAGSGSVRLSMGGMPTPPIIPATALNPGSSQPSSRPSTPGYFGYSPPPSAYPYNARQSWPIYSGASEDDGHDGQGFGYGSPPPSAPTSESHAFAGASPCPRRERRPSRLSLTFSNCEAAASGSEGERSGAASTRSVSMNLSTNMHGDHTRSSSTSGDERRKSVLFVVNGDTGPDAAGSGAPT